MGPNTTMSVSALQQALAHFHGTESYYKCSPDGLILLTEGAHYLAEHAGAYWLMDVIWSVYPKLKGEDFHVLTLKVADEKGLVRITDGDRGDGEVEVYQQRVSYTDFPLPEQRLFIATGGYDGKGRPIKVVMLPSEY